MISCDLVTLQSFGKAFKIRTEVGAGRSASIHDKHLDCITPVIKHSRGCKPIATIVPGSAYNGHSMGVIEFQIEPVNESSRRPFHQINGSNGLMLDREGIP